MVYVPAGPFLMGSLIEDPWARPNERPQHTATTGAYWIDRTEITNAQYRECVVDGRCTAPIETRVYLSANRSDHPVVYVLWEQAAAYCQWVGGRLPTEEEWEKAARGIDARTYPWGNTFVASRLNFCDRHCGRESEGVMSSDGYSVTAPVGRFGIGASPYGVLDMAGNVWEWTGSWYTAYPGSTYHSSLYGQQLHVIRGGGWDSGRLSVRTAQRSAEWPGANYDNTGFRCIVPGSQ